MLWSNASTFAPLNQPLPDGLTNVPVVGKDPSAIVVAWRRSQESDLVRSFIHIAADQHRTAPESSELAGIDGS